MIDGFNVDSMTPKALLLIYSNADDQTANEDHQSLWWREHWWKSKSNKNKIRWLLILVALFTQVDAVGGYKAKRK